MLANMLQTNQNAIILLSIAIIWMAAFLMTRITKRLHMPNVTGYILAGILIGPYVLNIIPDWTIQGMDFMTDAALAFIAFGVGRYLRLDLLKKSGMRIIVLTVFEALAAAVAVTLCMYYVFHLPLSFALLLGAIGSATAPASSLMTIRQYRAKGPFVDTLVQVVAIDDAVALIAFSICSAIVSASGSATSASIMVILMPLLANLGAVVAAVALGYVMSWLINERRSKDHRLVLLCAFIFGLASLSAALNISPLLSCMVMGMTFANLHKEKSLFKQLNRFTPPILAMFFVLSGMRLNVPALQTAGVIGLAYFFIRIIGKYLGAYLGAAVTHAPSEVRNYLGMALIPQAGVSIGLALLGQRLLPGEYGALLSTIILSSSVLYEMVGPLCAKASLYLSHAIKAEPGRESGRLPRFAFVSHASAHGSAEEVDVLPRGGGKAHWSPAAQRLWACKRGCAMDYEDDEE